MTIQDRVGPAPKPTGPLSTIDYNERIPNNVDLASDRRLQRALEGWQPKFLDWWKDLGPTLPTIDVYLRTAIAVGRDGWAPLRPRADGGIPLGDFPRRGGPGPQGQLRQAQGRAPLICTRTGRDS